MTTLVPDGEREQALRALRLRKSVLDSILRQLAALKALAPSSQREKLDLHAEAVRRAERELEAALNEAQQSAGMRCGMPAGLDPTLEAKAGSSSIASNDARADVEDASFVEQLGKLHASVIRTAFQCDLVRVATLQWCPGTNHVAFGGMNQEDPEAIYEMGFFVHHVTNSAFYRGSPPPPGDPKAFVYETLSNMYTWFSEKTADVLADLKSAKDVFGASVLDNTIVPYITEEADPSDARNPLPALIFGGRALGMIGNQFVQLSGTQPWNSFWMTLAQAYLRTSDPLPAFAEDVFLKTGASPIPGLWRQ